MASNTKTCPSCNYATRRECDTCGGTGTVEDRCRSCGTIKVNGRCPVPAKDCGRNNARRKYDLRKESATATLLDAVIEESDDAVAAFYSSMTERLQRKLVERAALEEVYLDTSDHPEVKELIRRGFRLKKSRGDRDVLEGPGGERRIIKRKNGKIHVVREEIDDSQETIEEVSKATMRGYIPLAIDSHAELRDIERSETDRANQASKDKKVDLIDYHDERAEAAGKKADKRKEGILRAVKKLTKEEQELFEDPFLTPAKLHKYISFSREDIFNAERSKRDDLNRAARHEDEAREAKNDDDRNFHNERAKKFSQSAAMTDKAIALRKKGLSTAAKRLLKSGVRK